MKLIANALNGNWLSELVIRARHLDLEQIDLAVAYVTGMDELFTLAQEKAVPLNLYALADGHGFPSTRIVRRFVESRRTAWRLFLTRAFYHPKIIWFRGVGAYIGSANLSRKAWFNNVECGVWLEQADLIEQNWVEELSDIFGAIHERCREATTDDLETLVALDDARKDLDDARRGFEKQVDARLSTLPGDISPVDRTRGKRTAGGQARQTFITDWHSGLTILTKIARRFGDARDRWPSWVDQAVPPSIVQDQATEWWWDVEFRQTRQSRVEMAKAHVRNESDPDAAVGRLLDMWSAFTPTDNDKWDWQDAMNVAPARLRALIEPSSLKELDLEGLEELLFLCHAAREHGRQIGNVKVGLAKGTKMTIRERVKLYATLLYEAPSSRPVNEVLLYALWGDDRRYGDGREAAIRIWTASTDENWKLPHLGRRILGELLGYARPDEFPPRNNRVSKTLFALGFDKITYD